MTWVADYLLRFMVNRNAIENEKDVLDFYKYGIEITVSTILSMVLIMLLGLIIHAFIYSLAFLITFVIIRSLANYGAAVFTEYDPNYIELKVWIEKANNGNNLTNKVSVPTKLNSVIKMKFKDVSKAYNKSTKLNVDQVSNIGGIVAVTGTWTPDYSSYK